MGILDSCIEDNERPGQNDERGNEAVGNVNRLHQQPPNEVINHSQPKTLPKKDKIKREKGLKPKESYAKPTYKHHDLTEKAQAAYKKLNPQPPRENEIYDIKELGITYQGPFKKYVPHGYGICHFEKGQVYIGNFNNGEAQTDNGTFIYFDGSYYEGSFKNSKFNGYGTLQYEDKTMTYMGDWVNGEPHGNGQEIYRDGSSYNGQFQYGKWHGKGVYQWDDHRTYHGDFYKGHMHGNGTIYDQDKNVIYRGQFSENQKKGKGILKTTMGTFEGNFSNDEINGEGTFLWANKKKAYVGDFVKSKMDGKGKMIYSTGQIVTGQWQQNHNMKVDHEENTVEAQKELENIEKYHNHMFNQNDQKPNE